MPAVEELVACFRREVASQDQMADLVCPVMAISPARRSGTPLGQTATPHEIRPVELLIADVKPESLDGLHGHRFRDGLIGPAVKLFPSVKG